MSDERLRDSFAVMAYFSLVFIVHTVAAPCALSQSNASDLSASLRTASERQWRVRAITSEHDTVSGRVRNVRDDMAVFYDRSIPLGTVTTLERQSAELSFHGGMIAGAAIGGLSLLFIGPWMQGVGDAVCAGSCQARWFAAGVGLGIVGAIMVTPREVKWITLWPR